MRDDPGVFTVIVTASARRVMSAATSSRVIPATVVPARAEPGRARSW